MAVDRLVDRQSGAAPPAAGRPARQPKQTREQLRSLMLGAAQRILLEEGLGVGVEALTFKRAFDRIEEDTGLRLTNGSIIRRVWENLAEYHTEVLLDIAVDEGYEEYEATAEVLEPVLADLDLSTPAKRLAATAEVCRVGGGATIGSINRSPAWSLWIGVWALATAGNGTEQKARIRQALSASYDTSNALYEETYRVLADLLGLRLRPGLTLHQITVATGALAEGCALRHRVDGDMQEFVLPTGPDGEGQEWTLFGLGLHALSERFFELDPGWAPGL
jgi:hypothetical protein